jgi:hypothetical protein
MPLLKAAIIGGGNIADKNHIPALKELSEQVEVVAVCSRDIHKARALADKHSIALAFDNAEEMYQSDSRPDLIINCTANNLHYPFHDAGIGKQLPCVYVRNHLLSAHKKPVKWLTLQPIKEKYWRIISSYGKPRSIH